MFTKEQIQDICALTPMQRGMLHHALLHPDSTAYHEQLVIRLDGALDTHALEEAWQHVIDHNDALRGRFLSQRVSTPVHVIPHREALSWSRFSLQNGTEEPPAELQQFLADDARQGFDLERAHAMRLSLFEATPHRHWLVWSFHHILLDGWSIGLVLQQVLARMNGDIEAIRSRPYAPYQRWLAACDKPAALAYWRMQLDGFEGEPLTRLDAGKASDATLQHACARLDAQTTQALHALARSQRSTLHPLLVCAWAIMLGRMQNRCDVLVPTVLAGRPPELDDAAHIAGLLINTVPMRVHWNSGETCATLLARVRDDSLQAAEHVSVSLAEIQAHTQTALPLDHILLVQGTPHQDILGARCGQAQIGHVAFHERIPDALEVSLTPSEQGIGIELRAQGLPQTSLQAWADSLRRVLTGIAEQPDACIDTLAIIDDTQRQALLAWGDGGPALAHGTVLQAFDAWCANTPEAVAFRNHNGSMSYRALDAAANRLAHRLLAEGPLVPDTPIALVARRDAGLLIGLLAILRAGAAYVPVDPAFPRERIRLMLEASSCPLALVSPELIAGLPTIAGTRVLALDEGTHLPGTPPAVQVQPEHLAYIIFTSGSTGTPKGVMVQHRNAASFFAGLPKRFGFTAGERMLAVTTVSFDIAALELLGALCCGMTVVLADEDTARDPQLLASFMRHQEVDAVQMTPTRLRLLIEAASIQVLEPLKTLLVGGEALPPELADQLLGLPKLHAFNVYGPTETTIWSSAWPMQAGPIRLGRALPGERLLVISEQRRLQPCGAVGEIAIAGAGLARGYLGDTGRTAERFIVLPELQEPVYLTGDLGRWHPDGSLEYLGRRDDQIKIRGMRIEIAEIEHSLRTLPGVRNAAAKAHKNAQGEWEIAAYLVGTSQPDAAALRTSLAALLPAPMIPAHFILLEALPQTPNGKIDRGGLPQPAAQTIQIPARAPQSAVETSITHIFSEVLGTSIGPDDDFFTAGGHSLLAIQAIGRVNRALSASYALRDLYRAPSAGALAAVRTRHCAPITRVPDAPHYPLSFAQRALWVLDQLQPGYAGYNVPGAYLLTGAFDETAFVRAWTALVERHESLRTVLRLIEGEPRQIIQPSMPVQLERHAHFTQATEQDIAAQIAEITLRPFDLAQGPLFRLALIALEAERHILVMVTHHIISDGWSDAVLIADLERAYAGTPQTTAPELRYRDFASWQQRYLASPLAQTHREYWRQTLDGLPLLNLPADGPRKPVLQRRGARVDFSLPADAATAWLQAVPTKRRYATIAAATLTLLHLESRQHDLALGLPIANRDRAPLQDQVGLHLNMLPLRLRLDSHQALAQMHEAAGQAIQQALEHADYPFARLVEELNVQAAPGRHPVFDAMLIYHQQPVPVPRLQGLQATPYDPHSYTARFDLDFEIWTDVQGVHGFIEYDADLFSAERAKQWAGRWQAVLTAHAHEPELSLAGLCDRLTPSTPGNEDEAADFLSRSLALSEDF